MRDAASDSIGPVPIANCERVAGIQLPGCGPDPMANRAVAASFVREAARRGAELALLPEFATTTFRSRVKASGRSHAVASRSDAKAWLGAIPPDLSVASRIRGPEWLYGYLRAFYRDDQSRTGWNNLIFPNVSMPHALSQLSGTQKLVETEYPTEDAAEAAAVKIGDLVEVEIRHVADKSGKEIEQYVVKQLQMETPGRLKPAQYKELVADLVNYMEFMAEPAKSERIRTGIAVLIFLGFLFAFAFLLKREYWKDVH